jgi:hypothetical protein
MVEGFDEVMVAAIRGAVVAWVVAVRTSGRLRTSLRTRQVLGVVAAIFVVGTATGLVCKAFYDPRTVEAAGRALEGRPKGRARGRCARLSRPRPAPTAARRPPGARPCVG